jgi:hypothetical protein
MHVCVCPCRCLCAPQVVQALSVLKFTEIKPRSEEEEEEDKNKKKQGGKAKSKDKKRRSWVGASHLTHVGFTTPATCARGCLYRCGSGAEWMSATLTWTHRTHRTTACGCGDLCAGEGKRPLSAIEEEVDRDFKEAEAGPDR